jgi:hypothetical protein
VTGMNSRYLRLYDLTSKLYRKFIFYSKV